LLSVPGKTKNCPKLVLSKSSSFESRASSLGSSKANNYSISRIDSNNLIVATERDENEKGITKIIESEYAINRSSELIKKTNKEIETGERDYVASLN